MEVQPLVAEVGVPDILGILGPFIIPALALEKRINLLRGEPGRGRGPVSIRHRYSPPLLALSER
jgi:hypothetical protein